MKKYYISLIQKFKSNFYIKKLNVEKIILHTGISSINNNKKYNKDIFDSFIFLTGQKPLYSKIKKSISNFKTRRGDIGGIYVTLRNDIMWDFYHKLINIVLPKVKEFKGINSNSIDRFGNLNFGIKDSNVFPDFFKNFNFGININIIVKKLYRDYKLFYKFINLPII